MKQCATCKEWKPEYEFCKNGSMIDGLQRQCKPCQRESNRRYYYSEKGQRQKHAYEKSPQGIEARRRAIRKYKQTENGKNHLKQEDARRRKKYPNKFRARLAISHAIEAGNMPSASTLTCVICGQPAAEYHHHRGYEPEYWLDVVPLCKGCHITEDSLVHNLSAP